MSNEWEEVRLGQENQRGSSHNRLALLECVRKGEEEGTAMKTK